jgi:hypothetical protein
MRSFVVSVSKQTDLREGNETHCDVLTLKPGRPGTLKKFLLINLTIHCHYFYTHIAQ